MQLPARPSRSPRRLDLLDRTSSAVHVPWPVRVVADASERPALGAFGGTVVDVPDRPSREALDAVGDLLAAGARIQLRVFASWDGAAEGDSASDDEVLRALVGAAEEVLVGSRGHLVHLASRRAFADASAVRIVAPRPAFAPAAGAGGVLDCRIDESPLSSADEVARDRATFERALPGAGVVLVSHDRPLGGSAFVDGLLETGRAVVASGAAACGLEGPARARLVLLEDGALESDWHRLAQTA
ncbi:MAG: hypothetical protein AAFU73_17535 [Planctomycetota bacterium]